MQQALLLACPGCTLGSPGFYLVCMVLGGMSVVSLLLQMPASRVDRIWGMPRITLPQIVGLLPLLLLPTVMFFVGMSKHDLTRCLFGTYGLVICVVYLWIRLCWLMEQLNVRSAFAQILFPGVIFPGMILVGTFCGYTVLATLVIGGFLPGEAIQFFIPRAAICAVFYGLLALAMKATFPASSPQLVLQDDGSIIYLNTPTPTETEQDMRQKQGGNRDL